MPWSHNPDSCIICSQEKLASISQNHFISLERYLKLLALNLAHENYGLETNEIENQPRLKSFYLNLFSHVTFTLIKSYCYIQSASLINIVILIGGIAQLSCCEY